MPVTLNGSTQYLSGSSAPATTTPIYMDAWVYFTSLPSTNTRHAVHSLSNTSTGAIYQLSVINSGGNIYVEAMSGTSPTFGAAYSTTQLTSTNIWYYVSGYFVSNALRYAWLDGGSIGSSSTSVSVSGINSYEIGATMRTGSASDYFAGQMSEASLVAAGVSSDMVTAIAAGRHSAHVFNDYTKVHVWAPMWGLHGSSVYNRAAANGTSITATGSPTFASDGGPPIVAGLHLPFMLAEVAGPQYVYPTSDVTNEWASGTYADIDEGATPIDSDFAYTADNPSSDVFEVHVDDPNDPGIHTDHTVRWRHVLIDGGSLASDAGTGCTLNVYLYQGTTLIASKTSIVLDSIFSWTEDSFVLTTGEAANITDYTDLRIRWVAAGGGGGPASRRGAGVSWAELEVPAAESASVTGTGAVTLPSLTVAATGDVLIDGAGAVTLPSVTVAATGDVPRTADGAVTLPALTVAASGSVVVTGDGSVTLPSLTGAGTGTVLVDGAGAVTLPSLTVASAGTVLVDGSGALTLPSLSVSASGDVPRTADSAITLPLLTVAGTGGGSPQISGDGAIVLPSLTVAGAGLVPRTGNGAVAMPVLTVAGTGSVLVSGDGAVTLPALVVAGIGGGVVLGDGAVTLPLLMVAGSAYTSRTGDGAVTIPVLFVTARDITSFTEHLEDTMSAMLYDFPNDCLRVHWYETDQWISVDWSQCETAMDATDIDDVTETAKANIRFVMRGIPEMRFDWDGSEDAYEPTDDPTFTLTESDLTT